MQYGMFTDAGNAMIHGVVLAAKYNGITKNYWHDIENVLEKIANIKGFEEATDTAVREEIWYTLFGEN